MQPEGEYMGCVEKVLATTAKTGNPQLEIVCFIDENMKRVVYLPLTDKARSSWVDAILEGIGFNGDFTAPTIDEDYYKDYSLPLYCKHEKNNKDALVEKWSISNGGGSRNAPVANDLAARLNASWRARSGSKKPPAPPAKHEEPAEPTERAPAPKGPPPKREPAKPATPAYGKEDAFDDCDKGMKGVGVDTDEWNAAIDAVGDDEDLFTSDQWKQVVKNYLKDACPF